jgi:hypothetical protein
MKFHNPSHEKFQRNIHNYVALFHMEANKNIKYDAYNVINKNFSHMIYDHFILAHFEKWHTLSLKESIQSTT